MATNRLAGKYAWVFIDEIYLLFKYFYSAQFLYKCWKQFRKYAAAMTGATQNVEECLRSDTARLLNISQSQMGHITNAPVGHGLLQVGGSIVPLAVPPDDHHTGGQISVSQGICQ